MTLSRIDTYPTHEYNGYKLRAGKLQPFGATLVPDGVNFSVFSSHATSCTLVLFNKNEDEPFIEIPFLDQFRVGNVYAMTVFDLPYEEIDYGFRFEGPWDPNNGHRFDSSKILSDPYAKIISGRDIWGHTPDWDKPYPYRSRLVIDDFDWEDDRPLEIPIEDWEEIRPHLDTFVAQHQLKPHIQRT